MFTWLALVLALAAGQTVPRTDRPAYVREGDRVEQEFRTYRDRLERFHSTLLAIIQRDIPLLQSELREPPPQPVVYGYQLLPRIVDNAFGQARPVTSFAYSWPITRGYINGEGIKLDRAEAEMQLAEKSTGVAKSTLILSLIAFRAVTSMDKADFLAWGWRLPFLASSVLLVVGILIRLGVNESPEFARVKEANRTVKLPVAEVLRSASGLVLLCIGANTIGIAGVYFTNT